MQTTNEFLDAVKARHQLTSDYQLAKFLGVRQSTISNYRVRKSGFDEAMALRVGEKDEVVGTLKPASFSAKP